MTDTVRSADESAAPTDGSPSSTDPGALRFLMPIAGAVGLFAAIQLTIDKITQLQDKVDGKQAALGCDIGAFVQCSGVLNTDQASAFGFPNPIIGIAGFAMVLLLGVLVAARVPLPRFVWAGLQVGVLFGIGFVTWLQYQSIYNIDLLCPWCMVVWTVMIPLFVAVTAHNLRVFAPESGPARFVANWIVLIIALWYVAVIAAIWFHFGDRLFA